MIKYFKLKLLSHLQVSTWKLTVDHYKFDSIVKTAAWKGNGCRSDC